MARQIVHCRAKLRRAEELTALLADELRTFFANSAPLIDVVRDTKTGQGRVVVTRVTRPPTRFSVIAGEVLHNLRSCLDQTVYQLILFNTRKPPTYRTYEFPIYCTEKQFQDNIYRKLRDVSPEAIKRITQLQPFNFERPRQTSLYVLNELNMVDKHRLVLSGFVLGQMRTFMASNEQTDVLMFGSEDFREILLKKGAVLGEVDRMVTADMAVQGFLHLDLVVRRPSPHIDHIGLVKMLGMLGRFVDQVLRHLAPAFSR
jgi:hypothetical protein